MLRMYAKHSRNDVIAVGARFILRLAGSGGVISARAPNATGGYRKCILVIGRLLCQGRSGIWVSLANSWGEASTPAGTTWLAGVGPDIRGAGDFAAVVLGASWVISECPPAIGESTGTSAIRVGSAIFEFTSWLSVDTGDFTS